MEHLIHKQVKFVPVGLSINLKDQVVRILSMSTAPELRMANSESMFLREAKKSAGAMCWRESKPMPGFEVESEACRSNYGDGFCRWIVCAKKFITS